jgi:ABC-2 type transport system permease protein
VRALAATLRAAVDEVRANRASFWTAIVAMIVNDLFWVVFWALFFGRIGSLRGWDTSRVLVLEAALDTGAGLALALGNARRIGALAAEGGFDAVLALPVPPLAHVLLRRIEAVNIGDVVFGVVLFLVVAHPTPVRIAVFAGAALAGGIVLGGFLVATGSLAFFAGRGEPGDLGFHTMLMLAAYPADILTGAPRLLAHSLVPAAFVATVPATLVLEPDAGTALGLVAAAAISATVGWLTFTAGLRRYTSGSLWSRA